MTNGKKLNKPVASLSIDLDDKWSYMKIHGDKGWETFPSYLNILIPNVLEKFNNLGLHTTFFIVGQDAALDKNKEYLQQIVRHGHEVGNHSFHHEPWFHKYPRDRIEEEIERTENCILDITGCKPIGFRGPGYTWSEILFEILLQRGYIYDASTFPIYLGPLARLYYFWSSKLSKEEKELRKDLYGNFRDGFRPVKPYFWLLSEGGSLLEIPVSTMPFLKIPFHLSYLLYLSRFSEKIMLRYLNFVLSFCSSTKLTPSFLLHPLDFLGKDEAPELSFFPGMDICAKRKTEIFSLVIRKLMSRFNLVNMKQHADLLLGKNDLKNILIR